MNPGVPLTKSHIFSRAMFYWRHLFTRVSSTRLPDVEAMQLQDVPAATSYSIATKRYLSILTANSNIVEPLSVQQKTYLDFISAKVRRLPANKTDGLFVAQGGTGSAALEDVFRMLHGISEIANSSDHLSIDRAVDHLISTGIFLPVKEIPELSSRARQIVYLAISWVCMIYSPSEIGALGTLQLDEEQFVDLNTTRQDINEARNPICEVLQQFGTLLPVKSPRLTLGIQRSDSSFEKNTLYVSLLNARTLNDIGHVEIKWVENVSSHLLFDKERRCLLLFSLPSFCHLNRHENTTFSHIVSDYYDQYSKPDNFSVVGFLKEVRLSYRLLFGDDKRGHVLFNRISRGASFTFGFRDPYLSELSKDNSGSRDSTDTYSTLTDFPILGSRLLELQAHMKTRNCGTITMLWQDRRDMLRWYTFWVVTIIGGLGLLVGFGQLALTAAQLYYAQPNKGRVMGHS